MRNFERIVYRRIISKIVHADLYGSKVLAYKCKDGMFNILEESVVDDLLNHFDWLIWTEGMLKFYKLVKGEFELMGVHDKDMRDMLIVILNHTIEMRKATVKLTSLV